MKKFIIVIILVLAAFLRLYNLPDVPPSASMDESSIGWNAYSVLQTGGDEFGSFPLISQRGYDDFRRSTYLLLVVPFIALFDLNVIAVRLPAVILSVITVWAVYGIVTLLFQKQSKLSYLTAIFSALFLAISPWHVYISRLGHESNACLSFLVFAIYFFLKGLQRNRYLIVSALFFILSMISYYTGQIVVPLLVFCLGLTYLRQLITIVFQSKTALLTTILIGCTTIGVLFSLFSPEAMIRYRGTSALSPEVHPEAFSLWIQKRNQAVAEGNLLGRIIYNPRIFVVNVFAQGYLSHFQPSWLFANQSEESFKAPNTGLLYSWQIPLILIGFMMLLFSKQISLPIKLLLLAWFTIAALPGAVATQAPHAMRAYNILPVWQIVTALGLATVIVFTKKYAVIAVVVVGFFISLQFQQFLHNYFFTFPYQQSRSFQYALVKAIPTVLQQQDQYKRIVFSNQDNLYQSYMIFLFQAKYDPKKYQSFGGTVSGGYEETHRYDKYEFRPIDWENEEKADTLFVGNPHDFPPSIKKDQSFTYKNGTIGVALVSE